MADQRFPVPASPTGCRDPLTAHVAALLDTEVNVPGVTSGSVAAHLNVFGNISNTELCVISDWARRDRKGRINPDRGNTEMRN